jgi:hypothetical protein
MHERHDLKWEEVAEAMPRRGFMAARRKIVRSRRKLRIRRFALERDPKPVRKWVTYSPDHDEKLISVVL